MSRLFAIVAMCSVLPQGSLAQGVPTDSALVELVVADNTRHFDQDQERVVNYWLTQLMLSALYQNIVTPSDLRDWKQRMTAPIRLHVRYSARATLAIPGVPVLEFDEVLLPLQPPSQFQSNAPDFIYLKRDNSVTRMAMYDPWVYVKLATEAGIPVHPRSLTVKRGDW